jgi:hypothetical protein
MLVSSELLRVFEFDHAQAKRLWPHGFSPAWQALG